MTRSPRNALAIRSIGIPEGFRVRGESVSRIEGFSDAAFAFAMTLLVISLEVPRSFDDLLDILRGMPAFAVCFAMLVWLWVTHYRFFRRYGLEDVATIALNSVLLFVIMLYVYPLKFVFTIFLGLIPPHIQPRDTGQIDNHQVDELFVIYGVGFIAVFGLFAMMNLRAWRLREALNLNEVERIVTREEITRCISLMAIGALSVVVALVLGRSGSGVAGLAGFVYGLTGVAEAFIARRFDRARVIALAGMRERGEWPGPA